VSLILPTNDFGAPNAKHQPPPSEKQVARVTLGGRLHAFVSILYPCLNVSDYFEVEKL
jgi:hypothetical protein